MAKDLLKVKDIRSREEIAAYLRQLAERLEAGETITLTAGDNSVELHPTDRTEFEVHVEQSRSLTGNKGETSLEIELEWDEGEQPETRDFAIE